MSYTEKFNSLLDEARKSIISFVNNKGVESDHQSTKVIKIEDENLQFNLDGDRYLSEISSCELIDNHGYTYAFGVLEKSQFFELADNILESEFVLSENAINGIQIQEKIFDQELFGYRIRDRKDFIDELTRWIGECGFDRQSDKALMQADLEMLLEVEADYMFESISTNEYIYEGCYNFDDTCKELLELNKKTIV